MFEMFPDIMTVDQLCEAFQIGKNTAYDLLNSSQIKAIKMGNIWKIPKRSLIDYVIKENQDRE